LSREFSCYHDNVMHIKQSKIEVRVSPDEKAQIRQAAEERGLSMSALVRIAAIGGRPGGAAMSASNPHLEK
jgi:Mobilization protein NikA